jgi:hypothetical protein
MAQIQHAFLMRASASDLKKLERPSKGCSIQMPERPLTTDRLSSVTSSSALTRNEFVLLRSRQ